MKNKLDNKRILLICPKFFNYNIEIINTIKDLGGTVDYFDERPSNNNIIKALLRVNKKLVKRKVEKYYQDIFNMISKSKYDYMLVIKPEAITKEFILKFKENNRDAKVCMYLWDSIENNKAAKENIKFADKVFSFDRNDCKKFNMIFRPLFYNKKYEELEYKKEKIQYDLIFVGTVHSDRYKVLQSIQTKLDEAGYSYYFYMYIQSKIIYYIRKLIFKDFKGSKITDFRFKPLDQDEVIELLKKSKSILDIQHVKQTGLTMRTIEMLGANKKLITTNEEIVNYDFYCEENIQVVDRNLNNINVNFIKGELKEVSKNIKEKYSIKSWLLELLE